MKTIIIGLLCMIISFAAVGQDLSVEDLKNIKKEAEVEVNQPKFMGIPNYLSVKESENFNLIDEYLKANIILPQRTATRYDQGTEVVQFVVSTDGKLSDFEVINSVSREIDDEVIRVLKTTEGMWKPGANSGVPYAMPTTVTIAFKNSESNKSFKQMAERYFTKGSKKLLVDGKPKSALRKFDNAMMLLPYDQSVLLMRGICRYECGDREGAKRDWTRLKEITDGEYDMSHLTPKIKDREAYAELIKVLEEE